MLESAYQKAIKLSKRSHWEKICYEIKNEPWGFAYKFVLEKLGTFSSSRVRNEKVVGAIINILFPYHEKRMEENKESIAGGIPLITEADFRNAANSLHHRKEPGPDRIPPDELFKIRGRVWTKLLFDM